MNESTRTDALLWEVCVKYGWCDVRFEVDAFRGLVNSDAGASALVDAILQAEGAALDHPHRSQYLEGLVQDWLFDPHGRGARSGLPTL